MSSSIFNGTSRYSSDFQAIIERSVAMASLPLTQLQQGKIKLEDQLKSLQGIDGKVGLVQGTLRAIEDAVGANALATTSSNSALVTATSTDGALEGDYTIEVTNLGAYSTVLSAPGSPVVTDASTGSIAAGELSLEIDSDVSDGANPLTTIAIQPSGTSLKALVEEINSKAGEHLQATIVNVSMTSTPDYRLSIQSKKLGKYGFRLLEESTDLMTGGGATGEKGEFKLNGITRETETRSVEISPKLTVTLLKESAAGETATVSVTRTNTALRTALTSFITAFNNSVDELDKSRTGGAALSGQSVVSTIADALRRAGTSAVTAGSFRSITEIGLSFNKDGKLFLDAEIFDKATELHWNDVKAVIGKADSSGFLKAANDTLKSLEDSTTGVIKSAIASTRNSIDTQAQRIGVEEERISDLEETLRQRMYEADAMIAMLEQQVQYFTGLFQTMKSNGEQYR
jgi:flagellar hook-associated protein 2